MVYQEEPQGVPENKQEAQWLKISGIYEFTISYSKNFR